MTRKRTHRRVITPLPPRGLRPKLAPGQVLDLALSHAVNLDAIAKGEATEQMLWDWVGGVLTWSRVAIMLSAGVAEMQAQLALATRLVERYGRTQRVGFSGVDYQAAKEGLGVMDQLAELVDRPTAIAAATWSERKVAEMAAECERRRKEASPQELQAA